VTEPSSSASSVVVHVFGRTDVGRTREHNEDAFVVADLTTDRATLLPEVRTHVVGPLGTLFMVADGMGGAAAGEVASQMATEVVLGTLRERWTTAELHTPDHFAAALRSAADEANAAIHGYATKHPENRGMGSTATIAGLLQDTLFVAQVGDSRGYIVRDGVARQITKDQSLVQRLIDAGELTEEEAEVSDRRNIILQALGPEASVRIELTHQRVRRGDVLILCSDGLSGQVRSDEIARVVQEEADLVGVCKRLIDLANEAGGPDNITVIAARFDGDGLSTEGRDDAVRHQVYLSGDDARQTVPISAITDDPRPAEPRPTIRTTPLDSEALAPRPRGPTGRTLNIVFGLVFVAVLVMLALRYLPSLVGE
jgi:PPM family protein phosphatase